jgi:hypothetical protein
MEKARVSSDTPRLNAFCRVAPSVLLKVRAMTFARVLLPASFFKVRTSFAVHARLFIDLASSRSLQPTTGTKTPRQFADIDLNHTFLFFHRPNRMRPFCVTPLAKLAPLQGILFANAHSGHQLRRDGLIACSVVYKDQRLLRGERGRVRQCRRRRNGGARPWQRERHR